MLRPGWLLWVFPFALISLLAAAAEPTPVREVDAPCARCHAKVFESYLATPMANASGMAEEKLKPGLFKHSSSGTEYSISELDHQAVLSARSAADPSHDVQQRLKYFLGSGHLGITYLYSIGSFLFESPVAWYAPSQSYDMKPGLGEMKYAPPPLPMQSGCLRCHMSSVQPSDPGTINRYQGVPFLHGGITCEACHADTAEHVRTAGKAEVVNPARLTPDKRDSVCISCHLEGDVTIKRAGSSALNYRPGESISTYLAYYVQTNANLTDRAVSEVEQLSQSQCKRTSGDRMSCMNCHDPHYTPDSSHRVAFFRGKCLACHSQPDFAKTHHPENQDCTACHMPQAGARNVLHVAWTDHRIRRQPDPTQAATPIAAGRLTPIFSPGANRRDQAMADYQALLEGDRSREPVAWEELNALGDQLSGDKDALDALGLMSAQRGESEKATQAFRRVLEMDPVDLTALSNLGNSARQRGEARRVAAVAEQGF